MRKRAGKTAARNTLCLKPSPSRPCWDRCKDDAETHSDSAPPGACEIEIEIEIERERKKERGKERREEQLWRLQRTGAPCGAEIRRT
eukprot:1718080-Rhodomonas_salina.1